MVLLTWVVLPNMVDITSIIDTTILAGLGYLGVRQQKKVKDNATKLDEVHKLVNQQLTDSEARRDNAESQNRDLEQQVRDANDTK